MGSRPGKAALARCCSARRGDCGVPVSSRPADGTDTPQLCERCRALAAWALVAILLLALPGLARAEDSAVGKVLLDETFKQAAVGSRPGPWLYFTDAGNEVTIAEAPVIGGHALKLSRASGTVWMPMVSGTVAGEGKNTVCLECDWYLPALSDSTDAVFYVTMRGEGNISVAQVGLGGPGGVAVPQGRDEWVPLGFPMRAGQWGHLSLTVDPMSRKADGAFDLVISQGKEKMTYPNIPFRPDWRGQFPSELSYTPTFHVGGGSATSRREAHVTNVRITVVPPREDR